MILFCPRARSERAEENRKVRSLTAPHPFHLVALQFATSPLELLILYSLFSNTTPATTRTTAARSITTHYHRYAPLPFGIGALLHVLGVLLLARKLAPIRIRQTLRASTGIRTPHCAPQPRSATDNSLKTPERSTPRGTPRNGPQRPEMAPKTDSPTPTPASPKAAPATKNARD